MRQVVLTLLLAALSHAQSRTATRPRAAFTPAFAKAAVRAVIEMDSIDRQDGHEDVETTLGNRAVEERLHDAEAELVTEVDQRGLAILRKGRQFFTSCSIVWTPDDSVKVAKLQDHCRQELLAVFRSNKPDADTSRCGPIAQLWRDEQK